MSIFYNEFDPFASAWLRALVEAGHISKGEVDARSIKSVRGSDCGSTSHFFAGIGGWPLALELAGWPRELPIWTGSCPCQPFSAAGKHAGTSDERHLWPDLLRLITERRPPVIVGEQVASKDGRAWLAGVRSDLEVLGYAVGAADLCAAGLGAPHIRQRLYWVAYATSAGCKGNLSGSGEAGQPIEPGGSVKQSHRHRDAGGMEEPFRFGRGGRSDGDSTGNDRALQAERRSAAGGMEHPIEPGLEGHPGHGNNGDQPGRLGADAIGSAPETGGAGGAWDRFELAQCRDGKARRFEPGSFPLAHGLPGRVGRLRGYGNAIVPPLAAEFIKAVMEALEIEPERRV